MAWDRMIEMIWDKWLKIWDEFPICIFVLEVTANTFLLAKYKDFNTLISLTNEIGSMSWEVVFNHSYVFSYGILPSLLFLSLSFSTYFFLFLFRFPFPYLLFHFLKSSLINFNKKGLIASQSWKRKKRKQEKKLSTD